ncbi:MAG: hypothetical protein K1Y01_15500 [Vicinamibacteria bacterium]|nr:hypothetical protein [Vicinamibacteria bacterium]
MKRRLGREVRALLPWLGAALVWFGLVAPMRADQENRLSQQSRIRRERLKAERGLHESQALRERIADALAKVCRASPDPAALRQRTVAAAAGLPLAPFALTVTGGPDGGATVEATGVRSAVRELLRRLGDPARGGFLRSVTLREKGGSSSLSATTGLFASFPAGILPAPRPCSGAAEPAAVADPEGPRAAPRSVVPAPRARPTLPPVPVPTIPAAVEPAPAPPFALVAFLSAEGKSRVSIRVGDEIRVLSVGESVDGWKCVSIDRDEGAVFTSPRGRVVLKPGSSQH